ncbi:MAG TPA: ABC transporter permease [Syntrophomonadaceae bacterium]|nr:ABC transporter permease [Syntrophomonadaceae bacterium]
MPSAAPLFSRAIWRKNMQRFWPIFAGYTFILLLISFSLVSNRSFEMLVGAPDVFINTIFGLSGLLSFLIAFFSIITAAAVFSFMYKDTSTAMINALPFTRRTIFTSKYLSGLFMIMIPLFVFFLSLAGIGLSLDCLNMSLLLRWLFIFFSLSLLLYSLAVIIGMFTGSLIAHISFFAIANFLLIGLLFLVDFFLQQFLYGFAGTSPGVMGFFVKATPIYYGAEANNYVTIDWQVWIIYLVLGFLFTWLALKMYENRKMESAGDVVAIKKLYPVFKYGVTFCSSLALGALLISMFYVSSQNLLAMITFFLLAGAIGYFVAEMLLKKSFRVLGSYKGFVVYACLAALLCVSVYNDWYGYATRMPDEEKVIAVAFDNHSQSQNYAIEQVLMADQDGNINPFLTEIPNLPASLALAFGTPISMQKDPVSNDYIYPDIQKATPEQARLLWSVYPGIYCEKETIDEVLELHRYLVDNIKTVKSQYRAYSYQGNAEEVEFFNVSFTYRLDNGKIHKQNFPLMMPVKPSNEVDREILTRLKSIAGSREERVKKISALSLPLDNIRDISIDINNIACIDHQLDTADEHDSIQIHSKDRSAFLQAVQTDYQQMNGEAMLYSSCYEAGGLDLLIDRPNLPPGNKFREGGTFSYNISVYFEHTFRFLRDNGYINEDIYKQIEAQRKSMQAKYNLPVIGKLG